LTQVDRQSASNTGHLITDYDYDSVGRLIDINNRFNTNNISHYGYGYDDGNRLTGKSGTDGISTVGYGKDNQISAVDNASRSDEAYSFNALGIRAGWVTDALDSRRVLSDGKYQYQYDDEGNLTQKKELVTGNLTNYSWDYRNRLTKVTSGSQVVEYLYDAEDKRVGKKINGVVTEKYIYDGADIALVVDGAGVLVERYLFGDGVDNVLSRESGGAVVWSLGDRQGSVVDLVDGNGTVLNHFVYDSFGGRAGTTGVDFRYGYTGRELDGETGLYYYRARYYDSTVGRFISEDPIGFGGGDTNLYRYVGNSPTNYTDPTGEIANAIAGAGFGALFGGLYAVANDIETGNFGWGTFGRVAQGAVLGAAIGAVASIGLAAATNVLAAGFQAVLGANTALGVATAGVIVNTTATAGLTAVGAYNAGGNFGRGKYLTGALDLVGVAAGAKNVFSGVTKGIPNAITTDLATAIDNLVLPGNPPGLNSFGAIVPTQSSALANRTSVGSAIVPWNNTGGALVLAGSSNINISTGSSFAADSIESSIQGNNQGKTYRHPEVYGKSDNTGIVFNNTLNLEQYGVNPLKTRKIIKQMNKSDIGKYILQKAEEGVITLELSTEPNITIGQDFGISYSNRAIAYVRNTQTFTMNMSRRAGIRAGYQQTASTLIHEGVHALGIGGSRRAEALARIAELKHMGIEVNTRSMRMILEDIGVAKVYDRLPWRINLESEHFTGVKF
jgi:RHS repeat-associated protein